MTMQKQWKTVTSYPKGSMLRGIAARSIPMTVALGELIDNSLDADAGKITIDFSYRGCLRISDDGAGCENVVSMVTLGDHSAHPTTSSGRYGVGGTSVQICLGRQSQIDSVHKGRYQGIVADWEHIENTGVWDFSRIGPEPSSKPSGTTLTISNLRRTSLPDMGKLMDSIRRTYAPAVARGRKIVFVYRHANASGDETKSTQLESMPDPSLVSPASQEFVFADGRRASVLMGILANQPERERLSGTFVALDGYRFVLGGSMIGLGDEWIVGLHATVTLLDGQKWKLNQNKTGFLNDDAGDAQVAELDQAIMSHPPFAALIAKAIEKQKSNTIVLAGIGERMSDAHAMLFGQPIHKAKRRATDHPGTGTVEPTHAGSRHKQAARIQPGQTFGGKESDPVERTVPMRSKKLKVLQHHLGEEANITSVHLGKGIITIQINVDHPRYASAKMSRNEAVVEQLAIDTYAAFLANNAPQQQELWPNEDSIPADPLVRQLDIQSRLSRHLAEAKAVARRPVAKV